MNSPTFQYTYDSTFTSGGIDTLVEIAVENEKDTIIVKNLSYYPIQTDTLFVWPNYTSVDSLWTFFSPDIDYVDPDPDYFQDSLTLYFVQPQIDDLDKIWVDREVFLNDNYAINPLTIGVVTFDGLNEMGYPHDWNANNAVDWADALTSKPIFMGQKGISDSIYISFYYQAGGKGESPESDDSLVLEFYLPSIDQWRSVWAMNGFTSDEWYYSHILLDTSIYFQDGFRFRFRSYGNLSGSLDHWNLDYVLLDENRSINDTLMHDWAFTVPPFTMLDDYTSMPWKHYQQLAPNGIINNVVIPSYNSSDNAKLLQPCSMDVYYDNTLESTHPYTATVLNVPSLSYFDMEYDAGFGFEFNPAINDTFVTFDVRFYLATNTTPERLSDNDTILLNQNFENYYAYDDGSAEAAYGLVSNGAELAYRFHLDNSIGEDTLRSLMIHFSPSVNDVSGESFFIQIWDDSAGMPGSLIYTTDDMNLPEFYYPKYNLGVNGFYEYELPMLIPISDTFYIGWKQSSSARLNVGFDKNVNRQNDIFYNLGSGFQNTIFEGSLMMRPVFVSDMDNLAGLPVLNSPSRKASLYPNPANSVASIIALDMRWLQVYDMQGRTILNIQVKEQFQMDISNWDNGIYLINIIDADGDVRRKKMIVQH